jgi:PBP1b-binding outer membrane lipoprotein LpoB
MQSDKAETYITIVIVASVVLASALIAGCSSTSMPSPSPTPTPSATVAQQSKAIATQTPAYIPTYTPTYTPANSIPTVKPLVTQTPSIIIE